MNIVDLTKIKFSNDRVKLRKEVIKIFLDENPGVGKGDKASRYKYIVKNLDDSRSIYLSRPANFNNGFDFTLNVSDTNFNDGILNDKGNPKRKSTRPTHENILKDLKNKKNENFKLYKLLMQQIDLVYSCKDPIQTNFKFNSGHPSELIIECIKYLFVEQDVTYWNYSGRLMFYTAIKEI